MKGKVLLQKWISRADLQDNKDKLYVFGDNMKQTGLGGQAGAMRGEPNAVGVPTKWTPSMSNNAFFSDDDLEKVKPFIDNAFDNLFNHIKSGSSVVIPADGLGTGLSQLPDRAPVILDYIESKIQSLVDYSNE
jgi:hypothetical protein